MSSPDIRINTMDYRGINSTERILTIDSLTFLFPFLNDEAFKEAGFTMPDVHNLVVANCINAVSDLQIKDPVTIKVCIPSNSDQRRFIIPRLGIGASTLKRDLINLYIDVLNPYMPRGFTDMAARTIVHEVNHVARRQAGQLKDSLLDRMIYEGLATYYQENWVTKEYSPWGHALTSKEEKSEWARAKKFLKDVNYDYSGWFLSSDRGHPFWAGYSLGTSITYAYFKNTGKKTSDATRQSSEKILEDSGYDQNP